MYILYSTTLHLLSAIVSRWATEDPNPTSKVAEKRRLEEVGTAAIQAKLDPRMVDAVRAIRALEDGEEVPQAFEEGFDDGVEDEDPEVDADGSRKRRRIDNGSPPMDDDRPPSPPVPASGLLTAETMEGLKYFAQLRQARGGEAPAAATGAKAGPVKGLGGLGDYGSDEEDD